jgi:hypothetical protein
MIRPRIFLAVIAPLIAGVLCLLQAHAQMGPLLGVEGKWTKTSRSASFTGPADIYTDATVCYSVRACSAALRGTNAMNVCNVTGGIEVACANFPTDATTGDLVIGTLIGGVTCASLGSNCAVKILYNQLGGTPCASSTACNLTNASTPLLPVLNTNCVNGKPCLVCTTAANTELDTSQNINTVNQAFTISDVSIRTSGTGASDVFNVGAVEIYYGSGGNLKGMYAGTPQNQSITDNNWLATQSMFNGASSVMYYNGSSTGWPKNVGSTAATGAVIRLCGQSRLNGNVVEGVLSPSDQTTNFSAMNSNQRAYFGF